MRRKFRRKGTQAAFLTACLAACTTCSDVGRAEGLGLMPKLIKQPEGPLQELNRKLEELPLEENLPEESPLHTLDDEIETMLAPETENEEFFEEIKEPAPEELTPLPTLEEVNEEALQLLAKASEQQEGPLKKLNDLVTAMFDEPPRPKAKIEEFGNTLEAVTVKKEEEPKEDFWLLHVNLQERSEPLPAALEWIPAPEVSAIWLPDAVASQAERELPARYDARWAGKTPVVKSQGDQSTCWALTVSSALEAALLPGQHLIFSPDHISLRNGFHIEQKDGGDYMMAMAYLSGWRGPVLEEEDLYGDGVSPEGLTAAVHVQEMRLLEGMSREQICRMIFKYGPVQTSLYMDRGTTSPEKGYYREDTCAYYYPEEKTPTHDVLILGWDDSYPKENFAVQPEEDGAYICQNTWGEDFGEQGIFYVSYEDGAIARGGLAYTRVEEKENYDHIYQSDVCGWQAQQGYDSETCLFANVFTAGTDENLRAVGFYATGADSVYEVSVVHSFADTDSFSCREAVCSGFLEDSGFYTVDLPDAVPLAAGERFAVVVKITTPGVKLPAAVEMHKDSYSDTVTVEGKEGYLSQDGKEWENTEELFQTNVCLKAYTDDQN